ncbi:hypothetical protein WKV44_06225 [Spirochaetia bacterium 38H-sp]|uniref:Cobalt transport protein n=1 Tax=Rarispira pelagica TaxID=3141764 RepID=A0ABU9UBU7_9SPIR
MKKKAQYLELISGIGLMITLLMTDSLILKLSFTLTAAILANCSGKRIKPLYFILFITGISFFELLIPRGRIITNIAGLNITQDALASGLKKGLTLTGLIFLSLFAVKKDLPIPGRIGRYFAKVFEYYANLMSRKKTINRHNIVASLDTILTESKQLSTEKESVGTKHIPAAIPVSILTIEIIISITLGISQ